MPSPKKTKSTPAQAPPIASDIASTLLRADLVNIVKKVKAGKVLNSGERRLLEQAKDGEDTTGVAHVKNQTDLADILGITRRQLQTWRKEPGAPKPASNGMHDVQAWRDFQKENGKKGAIVDHTDDGDTSDLPSEPVLKRRKLLLWCLGEELKLDQKRGELIAVALVREEWASRIAGCISFLRKRLENELPNELEGMEAPEIHDELAKVVDELCELMHSDGAAQSTIDESEEDESEGGE